MEDPQTAVITFVRDDLQATNLIVPRLDGTVDIAKSDIDNGKTSDPTSRYVFPNLRSGTGTTAVEVYDDETADAISIETGVGTLVQKCGDTKCNIAYDDPLDASPFPSADWYTIRLTKQPNGQVRLAVLTDGMVDVAGFNGVAIPLSAYQVIGGLVPTRLFLGNLAVSADGLTITRANGSDLGSFVDEGFERRNLIRVSIVVGGITKTYDLEISDSPTAVTELAIALKNAIPNDAGVRGYVGNLKSDTVSLLSNDGWFYGNVTFVDTSTNAPPTQGGWQVVRMDIPVQPAPGSKLQGFLGDGFLEGQWVELCVSSDGVGCTGTTGRYKIAIIRGHNEAKDTTIEFRSYVDLGDPSIPDLPAFHLVDDLGVFGASGTTAKVLIRRIAPVMTFEDDNWFVEQRVDLVADVGYAVPISRQGVKVFPVQKHGLYKLQGPLAVEGGVTGADRSLNLGVKLPGEWDGPLFKIGTQPPESKQIDVLNIYNDGSKADTSGVLTSTTLTGFGLAKDLNFGPTYSSGNPQTFGEPAIFPGGISFGSVQFVDGAFQTNGAKSTIEVLNFMNGIGNDRIDIQGTLDPDDPVKLTGSVILTATAGGVNVSRSQPFDWKAQGFLIGQPVKINSFGSQLWKVVGFSDTFDGDTVDNSVMHLQLVSGPALTPPLQPEATLTPTFSIEGYATGAALVRASGNWVADGFVIGQRVTSGAFTVIGAATGEWQVLAVGATTLLLGSGPGIASAGSAARAVTRVTPVLRELTAQDVPVQATVPITITPIVTVDPTTLEQWIFGGYVTGTFAAGQSWKTFGFIEGQLVMIQGLEGAWRLRRIEGTNDSVLRLERGAEMPTIATAETRMVFWPGPHGGLTVVHGGGNTALRIEFPMTTAGTTPNTITRLDGLSWTDAGFSLNQRVQVEGDGKTRTITDFVNLTPCPFSDPFPNCGVNSTMQLSDDAFGDKLANARTRRRPSTLPTQRSFPRPG